MRFRICEDFSRSRVQTQSTSYVTGPAMGSENQRCAARPYRVWHLTVEGRVIKCN